MNSFGSAEALVVLFLILMIGIPIWIALKAKPLGVFPYRWATYWAIESAVIAITTAMSDMSTIAKRGFDAGAFLFLLMTVLCLLAAVGLLYRMRAGAVLLIASEIMIFLLPALIGALYNSPVNTQPNTAPVIVLIIVNIFYFKKRWRSMVSDLWPSKHARRFARASFTWEKDEDISGWLSRDPENDDWILWDEKNKLMLRRRFSDPYVPWVVSQEDLEQCLELGRRYRARKTPSVEIQGRGF